LFHRASRQGCVPRSGDTHRAGPIRQQHSRFAPDHVQAYVPVAKDLPEPESHSTVAKRFVQQHDVPANGGVQRVPDIAHRTKDVPQHHQVQQLGAERQPAGQYRTRGTVLRTEFDEPGDREQPLAV